MVDENITESEIWADIDAAFCLSPRMPEDIDCHQLMQRYGFNETTARRKMKNLEASGNWEILTVEDGTSGTGRRTVIRKVKRG